MKRKGKRKNENESERKKKEKESGKLLSLKRNMKVAKKYFFSEQNWDLIRWKYPEGVKASLRCQN